MGPEQYRKAARDMRKLADRLDAQADPQTPRERASRTRTVYAITHHAQQLARRHRQLGNVD